LLRSRVYQSAGVFEESRSVDPRVSGGAGSSSEPTKARSSRQPNIFFWI